MDEAPSRVVILDAGSQYGKRIDRRVRELNIKSDLRPLGCPADEIRRAGYEAIIISGGPSSVLDENAPPFDEEIFRLGIPVLGICYGKQLMVKCCGGKIIKKIGREDGQCEVDLHLDSPIFKDLPKAVKVLLTHGDGMEDPPPGFDEIARQDTTIVGIANHDAKLYGLQFHPEVDLTENGAEMMKNFLYDVAGIKPDYTMGSREQMCIDHIKTVVGDKKVLMLISGGIDSTVSALLLRKALPEDQLYAVFIDNGFMRKDEPDQVEANLKKLGINVKMVPAWNRFYFASLNHAEKENVEEEKPQARALSAVTDPEEKRHIIGDTFVEVAQEVMRELNLNPENTFLGQGTLRPDLIESASNLASSAADVIKTHHNDSELVRQWRKRGRVIEPLTDFHKDEVRNLGRDLGLSEEYCGRHPFPGPGLAIRIICAYEPFMGKDFAETQVLIKVICGLAQAKETDHALYHRVVTATSENERDRLLQISEIGFSGSLLPIRTVGVQGDGRSYSYCAALSCVQNFKVDWDAALFLARIIPKVCHNVNRVAYAFGGPIVHPVTDITPTYLTKIPLSLAREADAIAHEILREHDMYNHIAQMPVVVIPIQFDRDPANNFKVPPCARSIVLRPFLSKDFMTGRPAVPGKDIPPAVVADMGTILTGIAGVSRVLYDLTSKPPGTTEWE